MSEELQAKVDGLRRDYEKLMDAVAMSDVTEELGDTATEIAGLPGKVQQIRSAGYAYASYLENKVETLDRQWGEVRHQIQQAIRTEFMNSRGEIAELDTLWDQLDAAMTGETLSAAGGSGGMMGSLSNLGDKMKSKRQGQGLGAMIQSALDEGESDAEDFMSSLKKFSAQSSARPATASLGAVSAAQVEGVMGQVESAMRRTESTISAAKSRIRGLYGQVPQNVSQTLSQIRNIETYLERAQNATFDWRAGEDVYMVVKAEWKKTGKKKDDPDGFFYISNQRIMMEQVEKKGGFMGFGGKKVEDLLWEAPIGSIEDVSYENKGMFGGIDLIHIKFGSGGPFAEVTVEVKDGFDSKVFASKLKQAASGEIEKERGLERDQALVEAIADAPTMCPVCGANFDQEIVRGMTQLECAYCGAVVRLGTS